MTEARTSFEQMTEFGDGQLTDLDMIEAEIAVELEDAAPAEIKAAIYRSLNDFAIKSRAVIIPIVLDSVACQEVYSLKTISDQCGWVVSEVDDVYLNGCRLSPTNRVNGQGVRSLGDTFVYSNEKLILPQVLESRPMGVEVLAILQPVPGTIKAPLGTVVRYGNVIKDGALANLYRMKKKSWFDPGTAYQKDVAFFNGVGRARGEIYGMHTGHVGNPVPLEQRFF